MLHNNKSTEFDNNIDSDYITIFTQEHEQKMHHHCKNKYTPTTKNRNTRNYTDRSTEQTNCTTCTSTRHWAATLDTGRELEQGWGLVEPVRR